MNEELRTLFISICIFLVKLFDMEREMILCSSYPSTGFLWAEHRAEIQEAVMLASY